MRVDWCVSSWFRIKNTHSHQTRVQSAPPARLSEALRRWSTNHRGSSDKSTHTRGGHTSHRGHPRVPSRICHTQSITLISDAHEWIREIPTVPIYCLAKPQPRERAWKNQRGKKTLLSLTLVRLCEMT